MATKIDGAVASFRAGFAGTALARGDDGYEEVRALWNGVFYPHPVVTARCRTPADVVSTVAFARQSGLPLAVRGGGHSFAGLSSCNDGIMLDLSLMNAVVARSEEQPSDIKS